MLTKTQMDNNRERFLSLVNQINREGADIQGLINKLNSSDFFYAPASTRYHGAFEGGLCAHSLNVYDNLTQLNDSKDLKLDSQSILITALFHDISKMNYYEMATRNVKTLDGKWTTEPFIKTKDASERFIYAGHGANSEYMIGRFIPLTVAESVAIINHMGGKDIYTGAVSDVNISEVFNRYSLALYLHIADMISTFDNEKLV